MKVQVMLYIFLVKLHYHAIELICNVTGFATWRVNVNDRTDGEFTPNGLVNGDGHMHGVDGTNILINVPMNNTEYACVSNVGLDVSLSDPAFLNIAGKHTCTYVLKHLCGTLLLLHFIMLQFQQCLCDIKFT